MKATKVKAKRHVPRKRGKAQVKDKAALTLPNTTPNSRPSPQLVVLTMVHGRPREGALALLYASPWGYATGPRATSQSVVKTTARGEARGHALELWRQRD